MLFMAVYKLRNTLALLNRYSFLRYCYHFLHLCINGIYYKAGQHSTAQHKTLQIQLNDMLLNSFKHVFIGV